MGVTRTEDWIPANSTNAPTSTADDAAMDATVAQALRLLQLGSSLRVYVYPVLMVLGTFGNVMSIVIMRRLMTRDSTINLFFMALAGGDLVVLYTGLVLKWANYALGVNVIDDWPALYFPMLILYFASGGFVSWVLVGMTVQRALSVAWPHHVGRLFTRGGVVRVIWAVAIFQVLLYVHHLYCVYATAAGLVTGSQCIGLPSFPYVWFLDNVFIYLAMVLTSVLPFLVLVVSNGVLIATLLASIRGTGSAEGMIASPSSSSSSVNPQLSDKRRREANSITLTIIVVSLTFLVLTLPLFVFGILFRFKDMTNTTLLQQAQVALLYSVTTLLYSVNSATNFYLYCLTGRRFRQEFVNIFLCGASKGRE